MAEYEEVARHEEWESGTIACPNCGREHTLFYNGGELDRADCECGWRLETVAVQIDLVISRPRDA